MVLFELIKRCLDSGYELRIFKELGMVYVRVISERDYYKDSLVHQCEQIIPNDGHLHKINEVILYCIDKVDQLKIQHQKLLKQDNGES